MYKAINIKNSILIYLLFAATHALAQAPAKPGKGNKEKTQQFNRQMQDPAFRKLMEQYSKVPGKKMLAAEGLPVAGTGADAPADAAMSGEPIITEKGMPIGAMSDIVLIGKSGGTVVSPDGMLTVIIPEGALLSETQIAIQPIINNAPLGAGNGYRLLPDGTQFDKPVQLIFKYNDTILDGTCKEMLCIETQDADGSWTASRAGVLDTIAKTLTENTLHFSDWGTGAFVKFGLDGYAGRHISAVRKKQSIALWVLGLTTEQQPDQKTKKTNDDDDLAPLTPIKRVVIKKLGKAVILKKKDPLDVVDDNTQPYSVKRWTLNGVTAPTAGKNGKLTGHGWFAGYTAPDNLPPRNPVAVSVELQAKAPVKGQFMLTSNIMVEDYHLDLTIDGKLVKYTQPPEVSAHTLSNIILYPGGLSFTAGSGGSSGFSLLLGVRDFYTTPGFSKSLKLRRPDENNPDEFVYYTPDNGVPYAETGAERKKNKDNQCEETVVGYSNFIVSEVTDAGLLYPLSPRDPIINPRTWQIKGTLTGILFDDNLELSDNCKSSIPHPYSAEFFLLVHDFRDAKGYKRPVVK